MMQKAERNDELIADFLAETVGLGVAHVMGVRRLSTTDQTGKAGDVAQMRLVAQTPGRFEGESRLVDAGSIGDAGGRERKRGGSSRLGNLGRRWSSLFFVGLWLSRSNRRRQPRLKQPLQHVGIVFTALGLEFGSEGAQMRDRWRVALLPGREFGRIGCALDDLAQSGAEAFGREICGKDLTVRTEYLQRAADRLADASLVLVIEAKTKAVAKGRQRPLGGIGLGRLDGALMGIGRIAG